ncbi:MAG: hypothetical protein K2X87_34295 [Gemmataceae bacterium]|nr:hypothetical protein [Gemmataceae bacterium]
MPTALRTQVLRVVGAAVAAAAVASSPGRAAAECGDYVRIARVVPAEHPPADGPAPKPCDGPGCSGRPPRPCR